MQLNYENYLALEPLVRTGNMTIYTKDITAENWDQYYIGCLNLMKDGIEDTFVQKSKIRIVFPNGKGCNLTIIDFFFNCMMWYMVVGAGRVIECKHLFFNPKALTKDDIKRYIDKYVIIPNREVMESIKLNNMIDDALFKYMDVDYFSLFLASTVNLEDFVNLMDASPRFAELMNVDLSDVPIEDVKNEGMRLTNEAIDIMLHSKEIMGYEHCLADTFRSKEGTKPMQFKEFAIHIGTKPDGMGGAYPVAINSSYLNGGLKDNLCYQVIDSAAARYAQIITKNNVGDSGNFARILGWNCIDTILRDDPDYICNTKNFLRIEIKNKKLLSKFRDRWFRKDPEGVEYLCDGEDESLIGQTLYFRSPEFCESHVHGNGVCFRCYGKLAYNNRYLNIGKIATELITSILTQMRLSAKHLLETKIKKFTWNENFYKFIEVNDNILLLNNELEFSPKWFILIDPNDIYQENELDFDSVDYYEPDEDSDIENDDDEIESDFNEYVCRFYIGNENGDVFEIAGNEEQYHMYITKTLNKLIRSTEVSESGMFKITFDDAETAALFCLKIENDDIGKSLDDIKQLIDKKPITSMYDAHSLTQAVLEASIEGGIDVTAVHFEVLIMNQIRSVISNLKKPDWNNPNEPYKILTLKESLSDNPSVTISMIYQNLNRLLVRPLTYKKTAPSFVDVFFMRQPQNFMTDKSNLIDTSIKPRKVRPFIRVHRRKK